MIRWNQVTRAVRTRWGFAVLVLAGVAASQTTAFSAGDEYYALMDDAMAKMHRDMHVPPSGNIDRDFARMMIPHHQGAVDMAVLQLRFGRDPRLRRLAQAIIITQGQEIQLMSSILRDQKAP
jgi:uncharacterized protein (DUF305 family)